MSYQNLMMPPRICERFSGGPTFSTTVGRSKGGYRKANQNRMDALWNWTADNFLKDDDLRMELGAFFLALGGMANTFRFRDLGDHMVGMHWEGTVRAFDAVGDVPLMAEGDGATTAFQLERLYTIGAVTYRRTITKPSRPETGYAGPKVWVNGAPLLSGWTIDYDTGVLTFTSPPAADAAIQVAFMFECHAALMSDQLTMDLRKMGAADVTLEIEEVYG